MSELDMSAAKRAALELKAWAEAYVGTLTGQAGGWDPRAFHDALNRCDRFIEEVKPVNSGRQSPGGVSLDLYAPSIWHAACLVVSSWIRSRWSTDPFQTCAEVEHSFFGNRMVLRGQACPWPIMPSSWRAENAKIRSLGSAPLGAFQEFVEQEIGKAGDLRLEMLDTLRSESGIKTVAQHYGLPTDLVDFTFDPLSALHFALGRSPAPPAVADARHSCSVIFTTSYFRLAGLGKLISKPHVVHFPPIEARRLYLQSGLFSDFGSLPGGFEGLGIDDFSRDWRWIEQNCSRVFFPRTYPEITEGHELRNALLEPEEAFFSTAIDRLKAHAALNVGAFDKSAAVEVMTEAGDLVSPWRDADDPTHIVWFHEDFDQIGLSVARYLAVSALVHTLSADRRSTESHLDPALVYSFVTFCPEAIRALDEVAQLNGQASALCKSMYGLVREAHEVAVRRIETEDAGNA